MDVQVGDVIITKKPHPCGANRLPLCAVLQNAALPAYCISRFSTNSQPPPYKLVRFQRKRLAILVESAIDGMLPYGYYRNTICTDTEGRTHDV